MLQHDFWRIFKKGNEKVRLKPVKPFMCLDCLHTWYSKSKLKKPTCSICKGHRTVLIKKKQSEKG